MRNPLNWHILQLGKGVQGVGFGDLSLPDFSPQRGQHFHVQQFWSGQRGAIYQGRDLQAGVALQQIFNHGRGVYDIGLCGYHLPVRPVASS